MLWKWCKRRHPNKGKKWIVKKILENHGNKEMGIYGREQQIVQRRGHAHCQTHFIKAGQTSYLDRDYFEARKLKQRSKRKAAYLRTRAAHRFMGLSNA